MKKKTRKSKTNCDSVSLTNFSPVALRQRLGSPQQPRSRFFVRRQSRLLCLHRQLHQVQSYFFIKKLDKKRGFENVEITYHGLAQNSTRTRSVSSFQCAQQRRYSILTRTPPSLFQTRRRLATQSKYYKYVAHEYTLKEKKIEIEQSRWIEKEN
jgi:hypothetical protein